MQKTKSKVKKSASAIRSDKEQIQRDRYLAKDFGDLLSGLAPLDLGLVFQKPTESISIRLPRDVLNKIRLLADEQDIPYQSLIKIWLAEKVKKAS